MTTPVQNLLNPSIGIESLMPMPDAGALPPSREIASSVLQETSLESLYNAQNSRSAAEALLCPSIGDGRIVSPEVFHSQLTALVNKLRESDNPKIKALLEEEIVPMMQNDALLSAYRGLLLGG